MHVHAARGRGDATSVASDTTSCAFATQSEAMGRAARFALANGPLTTEREAEPGKVFPVAVPG